jgi:hypothetical protein
VPSPQVDTEGGPIAVVQLVIASKPPARTFAALALFALTLSAASPPPAVADEVPRGVHRIDHRIRHAELEITRWQRRAARWQSHVARAMGEVQRLTYQPVAPAPTPTVDVRRSGLVLAPRVVDPLRQAHRRLQALLREDVALEAAQQIAAWQSYLSRLQLARAAALTRAQDQAVVAASADSPPRPVTYEAWARKFLRGLGAPECGDNLWLVVTWETAESTQALYNPLATTREMPGATWMNDVGVRNYLSLAQGLQASRETLEAGYATASYGPILESLRACAPASTTAIAIRDSGWCRGCAEGAYIVGLLEIVRVGWEEHAGRLIAAGV